MRLLHTSDWHIGRTFHGQDLLADQEFVLSALADLAAEHRGRRSHRCGRHLRPRGPLAPRPCRSPPGRYSGSGHRERSSSPLPAITIRPPDSAPSPTSWPPGVCICEHRVGRDRRAGACSRTRRTGGGLRVALPGAGSGANGARRWPGRAGHQAVMTAAMDLVRTDLAVRGPARRSVVAAHAFVVGGVAGGSERSIAVGGIESVTSDVFDGIDYVALGHLHGAQRLTGRMRYSGSPLPYSFTEAAHREGRLADRPGRRRHRHRYLARAAGSQTARHPHRTIGRSAGGAPRDRRPLHRRSPHR